MNRRTVMQTLAVATFFCAALLHPAPAFALHAAGESAWAAGGASGLLTYSIEGSVGALAGTAYERVYFPAVRAFKISELVWDLKGIVLAGVEGSVGYGERVQVNLGYWAAVNEGNGRMVDRDWQYAWTVTDDAWTDESRGDAFLDSGSVLDLNLAVRAFQAGPVALSGILGYKRDTWEWSDRGGTYIYSVNGYRDTQGTFPDETGITYEQKYTVPYFGIGADAAWGDFLIHTHLLYSSWASATDKDNHLMREILFKGDFSGGSYFGFGLSGSWHFTPRWYVAGTLEYQKYGEMRGDVSIDAPTGHQTSPDGGSVEINVTAYLLSAGFRF